MGTEDWAVLLENVQVEYIALNLVLSGVNQEPSVFLEGLQRYFIKQGFELEKLRGSVDFGQNQVSIAYAAKKLPAFKLGVVNGLALHQGHAASAQELAGLLQAGEAKSSRQLQVRSWKL